MTKKEIPIEDYVLLGRTGLPVKLSYKYRLVRNHRKGLSSCPFEYKITASKGKAGKTKIMVLVDEP